MSFSIRLAQRYFSSGRKFNDVVIVSATRTPIGSFQSTLSGLSASQLGGIAIDSAIKHAGIDKNDIDEVVMGNVISAGMGKVCDIIQYINYYLIFYVIVCFIK